MISSGRKTGQGRAGSQGTVASPALDMGTTPGSGRPGDGGGLRILAGIAWAWAAGFVMFFLAGSTQRRIWPLVAGGPGLMRLAVNTCIEEALRLGIAMALVRIAGAMRLRPGISGFMVVIASTVMAGVENLSYLSAVMTVDVYWRIGYTTLLHAGSAALYALALQSAAASRQAASGYGILAGAFVAGWLWHLGLNSAATWMDWRFLPHTGTIINIVMMLSLMTISHYRNAYLRNIHPARR